MTIKLNWLITDGNVTVNYDGQTHIISRSESLSDQLIEALKARDFDAIPTLVSKAKLIEKQSDGRFVVQNGQIMVDGVAAPHALSQKILRFSEEGLPYEPLVKFAQNLQGNPSFRSVNQLFEFLEKNDHPITDNGCFIAYKKVRDNFLDVHSGTFDNSIGNVVEMPRNQVNEDPTQTCSNGLHVANFNYANNFYSGGLMLEVEVNPSDVVAVPADYSSSKMRVCKYKVLSVVDEEVSTSIRYTKSNDESIDVVFDDSEDGDSDSDESSEYDDEESEEYKDEEDDSEENEYPWNDKIS